MKGSVNISDYFYGAKTQFIIPLYQRKYAWQKKHCVRLFAVSYTHLRAHET